MLSNLRGPFLNRQVVRAALFGYVLVVLGLLTLSPFNFAWPAAWVVSWFDDYGDIPENIALFVPLGYFCNLFIGGEGRGGAWRTAAIAVLLSMGFETAQLFLAGRLTSLFDLLSNATGALAGASLSARIKGRANGALGGVATLDLPLINTVYLVLPLMWLAATGLKGSSPRVWLLAPLAMTGALVLSGLWRYRMASRDGMSARTLLLLVATWLAIGAIPGLLNAPIAALGSVLLALMVAVARVTAGPYRGEERRFEHRVLRSIWPLVALYLVCVTVSLPPRLHTDFGFTWGYPQPGFERRFTLRIAEQLAALTLLGYLVGESLGRRARLPRDVLVPSLVVATAVTVAIECAHGFLPGDRASLGRGLLAVLGAWFGVALYAAELNVVLLATGALPRTLPARN